MIGRRTKSHGVCLKEDNRWQRMTQLLFRCHHRSRNQRHRHSSIEVGKKKDELIRSVKIGTTWDAGSSQKIVAHESKMTTKEICKMMNSSMTHLSIENHPLNRRFVKIFKNRSMIALKMLSLSNNQFFRDTNSLRRLIQSLPQSLEELSLCWNGIDASTAEILARRMLSLHNITTIHLCGNPLGGGGLGVLLRVGNLHGISHVDLSDCDIGNDGALRLAQFLATPCASIRRLTLKMNGIRENGARFLAKGLARNQSLVTLHLHCNEINDNGVEALMSAFHVKGSALEELSLCANLIGDVGAKVIARSLCKTRLRRLSLNHNGIGDEGMAHLAQALRGSVESTNLEELIVCNNDLGNQSMTALADVLKSNRRLQTLELSGNDRIDRRGVSSLAKSLVVNRTLTTLQVLEDTYENHLLNEKLKFYLKRNFVIQNCMGNKDIPAAAWPYLISGVERADILFFLLQERPELFQYP